MSLVGEPGLGVSNLGSGLLLAPDLLGDLGPVPSTCGSLFLIHRMRIGPVHSRIPSGLAACRLGTRSVFLGLFASYENFQKISACFRFDDKLSEMSLYT